VATPAGAQALVEAAVAQFGRIDILVNNAGIIRWAAMPEADADNLASHLAVHVGGSFNTTRAAWPHMVEQGYGRIVMTTSSGIFGLPANVSYATAKAGVIGLTRSLATAGAARGIKVNLVAPAAWTRMAGRTADDVESRGSPRMSPDVVAPMVAFLAHEACPVSGEIYAAGAGRFARIFIASTEGYVHDGSAPTIEDVAANWATINDESGYSVPADLEDWSAAFMRHLGS
jgi:NAD(P)-dependent dehydrogenase (short-subunit alcohol dehydrogenase family)